MRQAEIDLVLRQLFITAPQQLFGLFVQFELLFGDLSHAAAPLNKNAGRYDRRFFWYWLMFALVINRLLVAGGSRLK